MRTAQNRLSPVSRLKRVLPADTGKAFSDDRYISNAVDNSPMCSEAGLFQQWFSCEITGFKFTPPYKGDFF
jgi:hypothetical protein